MSLPILTDHLTDKELSDELRKRGVKASPRTLRDWRAKGKGPPFAYLGRLPFYPRAGIPKFMEQQAELSTRKHSRRG